MLIELSDLEKMSKKNSLFDLKLKNSVKICYIIFFFLFLRRQFKPYNSVINSKMIL